MTQRVMDTFKYPGSLDSLIRLITAGCFVLCWFALLYVCVLFRRGDLAALEKAWCIRWCFVEKFDAEAVGLQRGRSFRKMIASVRAENVKKFQKAHSMAGMRSRRHGATKTKVAVWDLAFGVGRWLQFRPGVTQGSSGSSVESPPDHKAKRALEQKEREEDKGAGARTATTASAASAASAANGPAAAGRGTNETRAAASTNAAVVPVIPTSAATAS